MAAAPDGGYWLLGSDGGVFSFGGARFHGSAAGALVAAPAVGLAPTTAGDGYWLAAADGRVLAYGAARHAGNGVPSSENVVGIAAGSGGGYLLLRSPSGSPVPPGSGSGRRIVYSNPLQRVWLVDADGDVVRTYLVSGRKSVPPAGTYHVYSKSPVANAGHAGITMRKMVRFSHSATSGIPIGFHDIPRYGDGRPMQAEDDLGGFRSAGCVRQGPADAAFLWDWAPVGTTVVVIY
jgi:lipoprotein-anchoring transpeptidase ErfK/SrfK